MSPKSINYMVYIKYNESYAFVTENVQDGDMAENSRWSCSPSLGGDCTISYDLGAVRDLYELRLGKVPL